MDRRPLRFWNHFKVTKNKFRCVTEYKIPTKVRTFLHCLENLKHKTILFLIPFKLGKVRFIFDKHVDVVCCRVSTVLIIIHSKNFYFSFHIKYKLAYELTIDASYFVLA